MIDKTTRTPARKNLLRPATSPNRNHFSSGPCAKHPSWALDKLSDAPLGRSHRAAPGKAKLKQAIEDTRKILQVPDSHLIGIVPASDTGAFEMAMWSLLGARGVDVLVWESFGQGWLTDIQKQLKLEDVNAYTTGYGELPDLSKVNPDRDIVFTWNGTTSGVCVENADWIADDREGLTLCDATSAAFAYDLPWDKLDVTTFSWQKVLGGEAAHGVIILSPRAEKRTESYTPPWPMPKIFRLAKAGKLISGIFEGATINTPSMLCVEDYLQALVWAEEIGGLNGLIERAKANSNVIAKWVETVCWIDFLCDHEALRSTTSVCLKITDPNVAALDEAQQRAFVKKLTALLETENIAFDIGGYRDAPPGLRIWCGATVETSDLEALMPWLDWAFETTLQNFGADQ